MIVGNGWWGLPCFNGLSKAQQYELVHVGVLPWGYEPAGECPWGAEVEITTMYDLMPGPRFYCLICAVKFLSTLDPQTEWHDFVAPNDN